MNIDLFEENFKNGSESTCLILKTKKFSISKGQRSVNSEYKKLYFITIFGFFNFRITLPINDSEFYIFKIILNKVESFSSLYKNETISKNDEDLFYNEILIFCFEHLLKFNLFYDFIKDLNEEHYSNSHLNAKIKHIDKINCFLNVGRNYD